jgi:DNA-directed RNA polymerase specialized sigma24 family protein
MTREQLLHAIVSDKQIKQTCANISGNKDADELYQQVILIILELPHEKLMSIHTGGYLRWYIVRVTMYVWQRNKKTKLCYTDAEFDTIDNPYDYETDEKAQAIESNLNNLPEYDQRLLLEYMKAGSYRKLEVATGIPYRTIGRNIKKIKDKLK